MEELNKKEINSPQSYHADSKIGVFCSDKFKTIAISTIAWSDRIWTGGLSPDKRRTFTGMLFTTQKYSNLAHSI